MPFATDRRTFLQNALQSGTAAATLPLIERIAAADPEKSTPPEHFLTTISGSPRERGQRYAETFSDGIHWLLETGVYPMASESKTIDDMLRYTDRCLQEVQGYSPVIFDELTGMAAGAGIRLEEMGMIACHYELGLGTLPKIERCTAIAAGPPDTSDGSTYVAQSHDYMARFYGRSSMLHWQRPEGPSVLSMHYPGQWIWCGVNSAGIALCGTAAEVSKKDVPGPAVGIPWYVLAAQMLYQDSLPAAVDEARRAKQAGWSTLVLANAEGDIANVEYTPKKTVVETTRGHMARVDFACRSMLGSIDAQPRCQHMYDLLAESQGQLDLSRIQQLYGDHRGFENYTPQRPMLWVGRSPICQHVDIPRGVGGTLDVTIFNCTTREASVCRGPACQGTWQSFVIPS